MNRIIRITIIAAVMILFGNTLHAQESLIITDSVEVYHLGSHLALLEDVQKELTIEDVVTPDVASMFVMSDQESPNFGRTNSAIWARFQIQNKSITDHIWRLEVAYPVMYRVDLYIPDQSGTYTLKSVGSMLPFEQRDFKHRNILFELPVSTGAMQTYFLRIETETTLVFPLTIWSESAFELKDHNEQLIFGVYFGILFVMIFYNLFIFLSLRNLSYLYYVLFVASYCMYQMLFNGFTLEYLWPTLPVWNITSLILISGVFVFSYSQFTRHFLSTKVYTPIFDKILLIFSLIGGFMALLTPVINFRTGNEIISIVVLILIPVTIIAAILSLRQGNRAARYFLIALVVFFIGGLIRVLRNIGFLPDTFFTIYLFHIGSVIEVTLLSLGLADRINTLRQEKEYEIQKGREQYRRMAQRLLTVQDEERQRLSRDIHDSMGEYLTALLIRCGLLRKKEGKDSPTLDKELHEMDVLIKDAIDECHRLSFELIPPSITKLGLVQALQEVIDGFAERTSIAVEFKESLNGKRLTNEQELMLFRILQEALNNIYKHAASKTVKVDLSQENGQINLVIADDGKGFNHHHILEHKLDPHDSLKGFGLMSMQERAANLNGNFEINSKVGEGTKIIVKIPEEAT